MQMVVDARGGQESEWATISRVADLLGIGSPETVRKWLRQAEIDTGRDRAPRPKSPLNSNG